MATEIYFSQALIVIAMPGVQTTYVGPPGYVMINLAIEKIVKQQNRVLVDLNLKDYISKFIARAEYQEGEEWNKHCEAKYRDVIQNFWAKNAKETIFQLPFEKTTTKCVMWIPMASFEQSFFEHWGPIVHLSFANDGKMRLFGFLPERAIGCVWTKINLEALIKVLHKKVVLTWELSPESWIGDQNYELLQSTDDIEFISISTMLKSKHAEQNRATTILSQSIFSHIYSELAYPHSRKKEEIGVANDDYKSLLYQAHLESYHPYGILETSAAKIQYDAHLVGCLALYSGIVKDKLAQQLFVSMQPELTKQQWSVIPYINFKGVCTANVAFQLLQAHPNFHECFSILKSEFGKALYKSMCIETSSKDLFPLVGELLFTPDEPNEIRTVHVFLNKLWVKLENEEGIDELRQIMKSFYIPQSYRLTCEKCKHVEVREGHKFYYIVPNRRFTYNYFEPRLKKCPACSESNINCIDNNNLNTTSTPEGGKHGILFFTFINHDEYAIIKLRGFEYRILVRSVHTSNQHVYIKILSEDSYKVPIIINNGYPIAYINDYKSTLKVDDTITYTMAVLIPNKSSTFPRYDVTSACFLTPENDPVPETGVDIKYLPTDSKCIYAWNSLIDLYLSIE